MKTVAFCLPLSWDMVDRDFFYSWTQLITNTMLDFKVSIYTGTQALIDRARETLARLALQDGADYLLIIDADQTYPPDMVKRLAAHMDDQHQVVSGVTAWKGTTMPMVFKPSEQKVIEIDMDFQINRGLVKAYWVGGGGILVAREVFEKIGEPYFMREWDQRREVEVGEDVAFMRRLKAKGIDVWCDTDLHYGHLGTAEWLPK
jgi:cellulose synthase/poly-beta-1,6-N-acetylglucosamine synthase-like glycosyltransferase